MYTFILIKDLGDKDVLFFITIDMFTICREHELFGLKERFSTFV